MFVSICVSFQALSMAGELSTAGAGEVEPGKLFVGGIDWNTTKESMKQYFCKYGQVEDCTVMTDPSNKPRGFGFVKFTNPEDASKVLSGTEHVLDGKRIDPKPATKNSPQPPQAKGKVFVGGVPPDASKEDIHTAFCHFGPIIGCADGVDIKIDPNNGKPRGFAFVTFESPDSAASAVREKWVSVKGKQVEVKQAENQKYKARMPGGAAFSSGGAYNGGFGGPHYHPQSRHMAQQPANYSSYQQAYAPYQQPFSYGQSGYSGSSGGYTMYNQGTNAHGQAVSGFEGYNGYGTSRESTSYTPQPYGYSQQQQQPYAASQASHPPAYARSQQGYNGYSVRQ